jgi:hypothetical protein
MAKLVHNHILDYGLARLAASGNMMMACSTQPTTYNQAAVGGAYALADCPLTATSYTIADDTSGRKITIAARTGITVDQSGTFGHVAILNTTASLLLYVTTGTSQVLTAGNTIDYPAWKISIADPT